MTTDIFFHEWRARAPGERRSLRRAATLMGLLGLAEPTSPVLTVVGSKGKGTAATYASAHLEAAGVDAVTVTSPGLRDRRDRIRHRGRAISGEELAALAGRLAAAWRRLPATGDGYLSPSGLFTIAGALYAQKHRADALVLEAGMGGQSDETSLFPPAVVALSSLLAEHVGVLGDSLEDIAWEKATVAGERTEAFLRLPLPPELAAVVERAVAERTAGRVAPQVVRPLSSGLPAGVLPAGLPRLSAELGSVAAERFLEVTHHARPSPTRLEGVLSSIRLPGRLSHHTVPGGQTRLIIDSAIDRTGIRAALTHAYQRWPRVDHVLLCLPDHKDVAGAAAELGELPVTMVTLPDRHLAFTRPVPAGWAREPGAAMTPGFLSRLGEYVLVLGTGYFTGRILTAIDADTEHLFQPRFPGGHR